MSLTDKLLIIEIIAYVTVVIIGIATQIFSAKVVEKQTNFLRELYIRKIDRMAYDITWLRGMFEALRKGGFTS